MSGFGQLLRNYLRRSGTTAESLGESIGSSQAKVWQLCSRGCKKLDGLIEVIGSPLLYQNISKELADSWISENQGRNYSADQIVQLAKRKSQEPSPAEHDWLESIAAMPLDELWGWCGRIVSSGDEGQLKRNISDQRKLYSLLRKNQPGSARAALAASYLASSLRLVGRYEESFELCRHAHEWSQDKELLIAIEAMHGQALSVGSRHPLQPMQALKFLDKEAVILADLKTPDPIAWNTYARDRALMFNQQAKISGDSSMLEEPFAEFKVSVDALSDPKIIALNKELQAYFHITMENWDQAADCLAVAQKLCGNSRMMTMKIELTWTNLYLGQGNFDQALPHAVHAKSLIIDNGFLGYEPFLAVLLQTINVGLNRARK